MKHYIYLILSTVKNKTISYVGYTSNTEKRLKLHNSGKGAKFTRGRKWKLLYTEVLNSKSLAMKRENQLKKNKKLRSFFRSKI